MSIQKRISKGDIVLVNFPFTELTGSKLRPALVLFSDRRNVVVAFISSKVEKYVEGVSILVKKGDPEFPITGLKLDSVIRLDKIATLDVSFIRGPIGSLGPRLREKVNDVLCKALRL